MIFRRRFRVAAPLAAVEEFHRRPESLAALTPPIFFFRFTEPPPERLAPGDEVAFAMWTGPVRMRWRARIEPLERLAPDRQEALESGRTGGFADRQVSGPFAAWTHRHRFRSVASQGDGPTEVEDEIEARLRQHVLWGPLGLMMWLGLPTLFAWRERRTRKLLVSRSETDRFR